MKDEDIHAFGPPPAVAMPARRPRRVWPWVLGGLLLMVLLSLAGLAAALLSLTDSAQHGWHVVINGNNWDGWDLGDLAELGDGMGLGQALLALLAVAAAMLVVLFVVPASVMLALLVAGLAVAIALVVTIGSLGLVLLVVLSPMWLFGLLLWLLLRGRGGRTAARMNT